MDRMAWLMLAIAVVGCEPAGDAEPFACKHPEPARADLGTGDVETGFRTLLDGAEVRVELGPQGKAMVAISLSLDGFEAPGIGGDKTVVTVTVRHEGRLVAAAVAGVPPARTVNGLVQYLNLGTEFDADDMVPILGAMSDVSATVRDGCGRDLRVTRRLRLVK